jgi:hypothetical protein
MPDAIPTAPILEVERVSKSFGVKVMCIIQI